MEIKGVRWKLRYVKEDSPKLEGNDGLTVFDTKTIYISKSPDSPMRLVYWHEYLHAFLHECGIRDLDGHFEHVLIENLSDLICEIEEKWKKKLLESSKASQE